MRVEDVLVQTVVSLLNLGGRKAGLAPGTEDERDPEQLRSAIEGVRALLPLVEAALGRTPARSSDALSQLQMAYAQQRRGGAGRGEPAGRRRPSRAAEARRARARAALRAALGARASSPPHAFVRQPPPIDSAGFERRPAAPPRAFALRRAVAPPAARPPVQHDPGGFP